MLALLSDIHFCDTTAQIGNVATPAFATVLHEIYLRAERVARGLDRPLRLDLVFLGDIFDLLRTERWFEDASGAPVLLAERPWATAAALQSGPITPAVAARARTILDEAIAANTESLATLRGERRPPPEGVIVRRIYIPGNHDRLYLHDEVLRARILGALGAVDGAGLSAEGIYLHRLQMPEYGLLARHGHEWDFWNFPRYRSRARPRSRLQRHHPHHRRGFPAPGALSGLVGALRRAGSFRPLDGAQAHPCGDGDPRRPARRRGCRWTG